MNSFQDVELFNINKPRISFPDSVIDSDINAFRKLFGHNGVTAQQFKNWQGKRVSYDTIIRKYGSWANVCDLFGMTPGWVHQYSDTYLLEFIEKVWRWRGQKPVRIDVKSYNDLHGTSVSPDTFVNRWGGWVKFLTLFSQYKLGQLTFEELIAKKLSKKQREPISPHLRAKILKRDNYTCQDCGRGPKRQSGVTLEVHHIKPVSKGGKSTEENLETNCLDCNRGKSDRL